MTFSMGLSHGEVFSSTGTAVDLQNQMHPLQSVAPIPQACPSEYDFKEEWRHHGAP